MTKHRGKQWIVAKKGQRRLALLAELAWRGARPGALPGAADLAGRVIEVSEQEVFGLQWKYEREEKLKAAVGGVCKDDGESNIRCISASFEQDS